MNKIPIVFACDNNYAMPLAVSIQSMLENKDTTTFYDIYCLFPKDFSQENIEKIKSFENNYSNIKINLINMKDKFKDAYIKTEHISYVTYYRLALASILSQYDKCIYLDVDIVVQKDLTEMYNIDLKNNYIGAVAHPVYYNKTDLYGLKIEKGSYFNAGVLLMNLKQIREDKMEEKLIQMIANKYPTQDQDLLNVACYGKTTKIPLYYNFTTKLFYEPDKSNAKKMYGKKFKSMIKDATIIHYANPEKPWNCKLLPYYKTWRGYFDNSPFKETQLYFSKKKAFKITLDLLGLNALSLKGIRKWLIRIKWKKDIKIIKIFGIYLINKEE